jgi:hypothetical protein
VSAYLSSRLNLAYDHFLDRLPNNAFASVDERGWRLSVDQADKLEATEERKLEELRAWLSKHLLIFNVVSPSVPTGETAACWIAVSKNGKYAYAANAGSASVSSYAVAQDGSITLLNGEAGLTVDGTAPVDMSLSHNGQSLHVLSARSQNVIGFAVNTDGSLSELGAFGGLPTTSAGIAAH